MTTSLEDFWRNPKVDTHTQSIKIVDHFFFFLCGVTYTMPHKVTQIWNPDSRRYVKLSGNIAWKILKKYANQVDHFNANHTVLHANYTQIYDPFKQQYVDLIKDNALTDEGLNVFIGLYITRFANRKKRVKGKVKLGFIFSYEDAEQEFWETQISPTMDPKEFVHLLATEWSNQSKNLWAVSVEQILKKNQKEIPWILIHHGKFLFKNHKFVSTPEWDKYVSLSRSARKKADKKILACDDERTKADLVRHAKGSVPPISKVLFQ